MRPGVLNCFGTIYICSCCRSSNSFCCRMTSTHALYGAASTQLNQPTAIRKVRTTSKVYCCNSWHVSTQGHDMLRTYIRTCVLVIANHSTPRQIVKIAKDAARCREFVRLCMQICLLATSLCSIHVHILLYHPHILSRHSSLYLYIFL